MWASKLARGFFLTPQRLLRAAGLRTSSDLPLPREGLGNTDKQRAHDDSNGKLPYKQDELVCFSDVSTHYPETSFHITQAMNTVGQICSKEKKEKTLRFFFFHRIILRHLCLKKKKKGYFDSLRHSGGNKSVKRCASRVLRESYTRPPSPLDRATASLREGRCSPACGGDGGVVAEEWCLPVDMLSPGDSPSRRPCSMGCGTGGGPMSPGGTVGG